MDNDRWRPAITGFGSIPHGSPCVTREGAKLVPAVTAASIKLWKNHSCPRYRGIGQNSGEIAMKTILSALVALSVIAGVAGTASALDAKTFFEQIDRDHN
jgi:hypothetical protein